METMTIHGALKLIAGQDTDGARVINGVGFSGHDTNFGNSLAERQRLSGKMEWYAAKLVRKYRKQVAQTTGICDGLKGKKATEKLDAFLASLIWEYQEIPEKQTEVGTVGAVIGKDSGTLKAFVIRFAYNAGLVDAVRNLPSRRFDRDDKKWVVDAPNDADKAAINALIKTEGFTASEGAKKFLNV